MPQMQPWVVPVVIVCVLVISCVVVITVVAGIIIVRRRQSGKYNVLSYDCIVYDCVYIQSTCTFITSPADVTSCSLLFVLP